MNNDDHTGHPRRHPGQEHALSVREASAREADDAREPGAVAGLEEGWIQDDQLEFGMNEVLTDPDEIRRGILQLMRMQGIRLVRERPRADMGKSL